MSAFSGTCSGVLKSHRLGSGGVAAARGSSAEWGEEEEVLLSAL